MSKRMEVQLVEQIGHYDYFHVKDSRQYTGQLATLRVRKDGPDDEWQVDKWTSAGWAPVMSIPVDAVTDAEHAVTVAWTIIHI